MNDPLESTRGAVARQQDRSGPPAALAWLYAASLLAALPWLVGHFLPPHNIDAAAVLQFAERWLGGERLYVDLIDVNPPLIYMLNLLPAAIGRLTPMSAATAMVVCTLAFIGLGIVLSDRLLIAAGRGFGDPYRLLLPPLFLCLTVVTPAYDFSQRENLMVAAALPYLLLAWLRVEGRSVGRPLALSVTLLAAVGFAIKPHFLIVPALVEAYVLAVRGPRAALRDPVPWTMGAFFAAYAAYVATMLPEYLTSIVPLVGGEYVEHEAERWRMLVDSRLTPTVGLLVPLGALAAFYSRTALSRLLALAAFGAVIFALVQGKGWAYHTLPAECFATALAAALLCETLERASTGVTDAARWLLSGALLVAFMLGAYYVATTNRWSLFHFKANFPAPEVAELMGRIEREAAGEPVLVLGPDHGLYFPMLNYTGSIQASRFMALWPLAHVYRECLPDGRLYREPREMSPLERMAFDSAAADLARHEPRLVVVDKRTGMLSDCGQRFDFIEYFSRDPQFAEHWSRYRLLDETARFRYYLRQ